MKIKHFNVSLVQRAEQLCKRRILFLCIFFLQLFSISALATESLQQIILEPERSPVKLIFIHHSVGGHWLAHDKGGLVQELNKNNFYVNDVTYGWEPVELTANFAKKIKRKLLTKLGIIDREAYRIGSHTDIGQMPDWFLGPDSDLVMSAIYSENMETDTFGDHSNSTSLYPIAQPSLKEENRIVMFKSCFPNTMLRGEGNEPASKAVPPIRGFKAGERKHTVANAKRIYNDLLPYFAEHQDNFFVLVTPPPQIKLPKNGRIARAFCNWLVHDWLREKGYKYNNIFVFDLYNILSSSHEDGTSDLGSDAGNHHRIWHDKIQHIVQVDNHELAYPTNHNDSHPSAIGLQKATKEFVPLLKYNYSKWYLSHIGK